MDGLNYVYSFHMKIKLSISPAALVTAAFVAQVPWPCVYSPEYNTVLVCCGPCFCRFWLPFLFKIRLHKSLGLHEKGLAQSSLNQVASPALKLALAALLISAIFIGNAAYEAGNLSGALLGLKGLLEKALFCSENSIPCLCFGSSLGYLLLKNFKWLKQLLVTIVILMSLSFYSLQH